MSNAKTNVVDLFCGVGGFSLGFESAGFSVELAADSDETILGTYERNFPDTETKNVDLANCDTERLLEETELTKDEVSVVIGGPPCQGFSMIGNRSSDDERNDLVIDFDNHVINLDPDYFVMDAHGKHVVGESEHSSNDVFESFLTGFT